jgi:hypothetical protein
MKNLQSFLVGIGLFIATPALADCDLSTYDRSPPKKIDSEVNNGIVRFEWSTDADTVDSRNWIWHYVKNLHSDHGLGYKWPKADPRRPLGSPLPPGMTDCNRYFVTSATAPDDNAPITYGTNDIAQRAAVYSSSTVGDATKLGAAPTLSAPSGSGSIIETSYQIGAGKSQNVRMAVSTFQEDNKWRFVLELLPNVIAALALNEFLNVEQITQAVAQLRTQAVKVSEGPLEKTVGRNDKDVLSALFRDDELGGRTNQHYLVFYSGSSGGPKISMALSASGTRPISTDLILFQPDGQPFFATALKLAAPNGANP